MTSIRLLDLRDYGATIGGHLVVGVEQRLVEATGATTDDAVVAALAELAWFDATDLADAPFPLPDTTWFSATTVVDETGVEQLLLEAQLLPDAGGVAVFAPTVEGEASRWFAAELTPTNLDVEPTS